MQTAEGNPDDTELRDAETEIVAAARESGVSSDSHSQEMVWGHNMAEAWLSLISAGWGPGSPVWDDLDTNHNILLQSRLSFGDLNQPDFPLQGYNSASASSSSSCPMRPFFCKEKD